MLYDKNQLAFKGKCFEATDFQFDVTCWQAEGGTGGGWDECPFYPSSVSHSE